MKEMEYIQLYQYYAKKYIIKNLFVIVLIQIMDLGIVIQMEK